MNLLLVFHISLAVAVFGGFAVRYVSAIRRKAYPGKGRRPLFLGSGLLVYSGVLLSSIGQMPLASVCLSSLGLLVALIVLEIGLQKLSAKLAHAKASIKS